MLFKKKPTYGWSGNYKTWEEVEHLSKGYNQHSIFEKVYHATLGVIQGKFRYERDSIGFNDEAQNYPLLYLLQRCILEGNKCKVLDFGGALGSLYFQHAKSLDTQLTLSWTVVEQNEFVELGKKLPTTIGLNFENDLTEALLQEPTILILSSVLQYLKEFMELL